MATEQDLIIKIKAIMDQNVQRTFRDLEAMANKTGMGGDALKTAQAGMAQYVKAVQGLNKEFKIFGKDFEDLQKRQKDVANQLTKELDLRKKLRQEIEKSGSELERMQKRQETVESIARSKELKEEAGSIGGAMAGSKYGRLGQMAHGIGSRMGPGGALGLTAAGVGIGAQVVDDFFGVGAEQRQAKNMALRNQQYGAARSGQLSQGAFNLNQSEVKKSIGQGVSKQIGSIFTDALNDIATLSPVQLVKNLYGNTVNFRAKSTEGALASINSKREQYAPLLGEMDRYQSRALGNYEFMRQTGTSAGRDRMFGRGGIVEGNAQNFLMNEDESKQMMSGAVNALGSNRAMAVGGNLGRFNKAGFGDVASSLMASQASLGGVSATQADKRTEELLKRAMKAGMDDTEMAKNLATTATAVVSGAVGQFGVAGTGQQEDFMNLARLISEKYGGEMSKENISKAQSLTALFNQKSTQTEGLAGVRNYAKIQELFPGMPLQMQQSMAQMTEQEMTPENMRKKFGDVASSKFFTDTNIKQLKASKAGGSIYGEMLNQSTKNQYDKLSQAAAMGGDKERQALDDFFATAEGQQVAFAATGNVESGLALLKGQAGIQSTLPQGTGELGAGASGTPEADQKRLQTQQTVSDVATAESIQFRAAVKSVTEDSQHAIEGMFTKITEMADEVTKKLNDSQVNRGN